MNKVDAFAKLRIPKPSDRILLLTHTDLDGSGPVILLQDIFPNLTVKHCSNGSMSFDIKDAVCNPDVNETYDFVIVTDISCNEEDAGKINANPHCQKLILLDHHPTAVSLNKYSWACVQVAPFADSYRMARYPQGANAHTSATSLVYDYLSYAGYIDENALSLRNFRMQHIVDIIASYDTWDWHEVFNDWEICQTLDKLFDIYGYKRMEEKLHTFINSKDTGLELVTATDRLLLDIEAEKVEHYLENIKKCFRTGNLHMNGRYYSVVFCHSSDYLMETFACMEEMYPDYDLYLVDYGIGLSLRAIKPEIHIGNLMKPLGGGGHAGAGGTKISRDLLNSIIEQTLQADLYIDEPEDNRESLA